MREAPLRLPRLLPVVLAAATLGSCSRGGGGGRAATADAASGRAAADAGAPLPSDDAAAPTEPDGEAAADVVAADVGAGPDGTADGVAVPDVAAPAFAPCPAEVPGMVCIPGGPFRMGAEDGEKDERPVHEVVLSTYLIDLHEVTNGEFEGCVAAGACRRPMPYREFRAPRQPVVAVDWFNAASYCAWVGKRLPTEAEWEKAARGTDGRIYPWGDEPPACERAAYRGCEPDTTRPVGSFAAGAWGLFDMAGNSYEWVADWYAPCFSGCDRECGADCAGPDPRGPCGGAEECPGRESRVLKGGSWYWDAERMRGSDRRPMRPDSGVHRLGFRCAADAAGPAAPADPPAADPPPRAAAGARRPRVDPASPDAPVAAPDPRTRAALDAAPQEPLERDPVDPLHYVRSNEARLDRYFPYIDGVGGGYFGIGSDQNYTLLARARSELAWLMDYDLVVVRVHAVYRALVLASETPESFAGRWEDDAEDATRALVESAYAGDPELADYVRVFRGYRGQLRQYFRAQLVRNFERYPISWLSDPALYRYVRAMMEAGRIRALRGDLLGPTTVLGVGDAARKVGVPIRVAYLSNAEEWFAYDEDFRASFAALPRDERSVVLRTLTMHRLPRGDPTWHYQVESLDHFAAALADPAFRRIQEIVPQAQLDEDGLSRIAVEVPE